MSRWMSKVDGSSKDLEPEQSTGQATSRDIARRFSQRYNEVAASPISQNVLLLVINELVDEGVIVPGERW